MNEAAEELQAQIKPWSLLVLKCSMTQTQIQVGFIYFKYLVL